MNNLRWNSNQNTINFYHENAFQYVVCQITAIFIRLQYVTETSKTYIVCHCFITSLETKLYDSSFQLDDKTMRIFSEST